MKWLFVVMRELFWEVIWGKSVRCEVNVYVSDGIGVVLEFHFYRSYFDKVVVNKGCCLFGNVGEWYGIMDEHKKHT